MGSPNQTEQQSSVNTVLFSESVALENESEFIINKRAMILDALKFQGCFNAELLAPIPNLREEWITLVQFQSESLLRQWLNSEEYARGVSRIEPYINTTRRQFLSNFNQQVSFLITTTLRPENEEKWLKWNDKIHGVMSSFPGFIGSDIQPSTIQQKGGNKTWIVNFQFDSLENLKNWLDSPERAKLIEEGSNLYESSVVSQVASGFGSWFDMKRPDGTGVAKWKMPLIVEMALYPALVFQAVVTPFVNEWFGFPVGLLINTFYLGFLMQYFLVPWVQKLMNFWLLPQRHEEKKINIIGLVLSLLYLVIIAYIYVKFLFKLNLWG
ncbi:MAG: antibiotic biosynthesis monooxygenase [Prochloraceae cyanobacterium]|nr:antibiotic biosynthesis monooxygenase [Prochloraceae cyanobacterium]